MAELETFIENNFGILILLIAWTLAWKGVALWHSAKRNENWWFIAILVLNTLGILEIFYLFIFTKLIDDKKSGRAGKK